MPAIGLRLFALVGDRSAVTAPDLAPRPRDPRRAGRQPRRGAVSPLGTSTRATGRRAGHDNRTFRLGDDLTIRLPSARGYTAQEAKESRWLPELAAGLPVQIPETVARGCAGPTFPFDWSIRRWIDGETPRTDDASQVDPRHLAAEVAGFLRALRECHLDGPLAGQHSAFRGCAPAVYDAETRAAIDTLGDRIPRPAGSDLGRGTRQLVVWTAGLVPRRCGARQPLGPRRTPCGRDRLRVLRRRRPGLRSRTRVDLPARRRPGALSHRVGGGRRRMGSRPGLGPLEGAHHARRRRCSRSKARRGGPSPRRDPRGLSVAARKIGMLAPSRTAMIG